MRRAAKIDVNQPEIVAALRKVDAHVTITSQLKKFADVVVVHRGRVYIAEIKDGTKAKSSKKLTTGENECRKSIEAAGGTYHVLESVRDALLMIGEYYCRCDTPFFGKASTICFKCSREGNVEQLKKYYHD